MSLSSSGCWGLGCSVSGTDDLVVLSGSAGPASLSFFLPSEKPKGILPSVGRGARQAARCLPSTANFRERRGKQLL